MARLPTHPALEVFSNSISVGELKKQPSGAIEFSYSPDWLKWAGASPVSLSLPLGNSKFEGAKVAAFFENLLPDNEDIRRQVAQRVHAEGSDAYSLLDAVGRDCVGALQFLPQGIKPGPLGQVRGEPVSDEDIAKILDNLAAAPLGLGDDDDFRILLAGAQEKTALLFAEEKWQKPLGTTATTHILKPQIGWQNGIDLSGSVENEFFCLKLVKALGIPAADVDIKEFAGKRVLVVKRFDRVWMKDGRLLRLPQEDFCQALSVPPSRKYESGGGPGIVQMLTLLTASDTPQADQATLLKAVILFWLLGASDGHAKNFSLRLWPGGGFNLAPLYDVISVEPNIKSGQLFEDKAKLAMAVGDNRHYRLGEIQPRHFIETAAKAGIKAPRVEQVFEDLCKRAPAALRKIKAELPEDFPTDISEPILAGFKKRLKMVKDRHKDA